MLGRRNEIARMQSDFYRECYYKMLRALMFAMVIIWILIAAIIYFILSPAPSPYYATTSQGKIIPMMPMSASSKSAGE
jgi:hypothetical protein